jgi:hypothetical protein
MCDNPSASRHSDIWETPSAMTSDAHKSAHAGISKKFPKKSENCRSRTRLREFLRSVDTEGPLFERTVVERYERPPLDVSIHHLSGENDHDKRR